MHQPCARHLGEFNNAWENRTCNGELLGFPIISHVTSHLALSLNCNCDVNSYQNSRAGRRSVFGDWRGRRVWIRSRLQSKLLALSITYASRISFGLIDDECKVVLFGICRFSYLWENLHFALHLKRSRFLGILSAKHKRLFYLIPQIWTMSHLKWVGYFEEFRLINPGELLHLNEKSFNLGNFLEGYIRCVVIYKSRIKLLETICWLWSFEVSNVWELISCSGFSFLEI